jgi:holo-[acyl-carrier protein] synthase
LRIHGRAAELASQMGLRSSHLSLTHDAGVAVAVVIFEGD